MRRTVLCALIGIVALAVSGCGGSGTGSAVVERDFARIRPAFSGWRAFPFHATCPDTAGGSPTAEVDAAYGYPTWESDPPNQVYIRVSYRSPANARREIAGFATPAELRCRKAAIEAERITNTIVPRTGPPYGSPTVRFAPGVPSWLTQLLGHRLQGYRELFIPPFGLPRVYGLLFIYADPRNPHITYSAAMDVSGEYAIDPHADRTQKRDVLRLIHAIR